MRIETADGIELAAEERVVPGAHAAAVLLHPHPRMGGDMTAPVPAHLAGTLPPRGISTLRFDFRGAGRSSGTHGGGTAEAADVVAAVERLSADSPGVPLWLVGWSFGADVSLQVLDHQVAGWILVAPPLSSVPRTAMVAAADPRPKLLLVPEHDQFLDPVAAEAATADWVSTTVQVIVGADHFLAGRMGPVLDAVVATLDVSDDGDAG